MVAGYEAGGSTLLSSQMKGLSKLIDSLTALQGFQTRVMALPQVKLSAFSMNVLLAITYLTSAAQTYR